MGRNTGRGKVAYNWISPDPAKAGPTVGVIVVVYLNMLQIMHTENYWAIVSKMDR